MAADSPREPLRELALKSRHEALGARFGEFAGWQMPLWYRGAVEEHMAVRRHAGVFDISHMGRLRLNGEDAGAVLASLFTRDPRALDVGASAYSFICNESGGIVDDLITYRLTDEEYLVICNAANAVSVRGAIEAVGMRRDVGMIDLRDEDTVLLAVQGPEAVELVVRLIDGAGDVARHRCAEVTHVGREFFLTRTGYTGEDGFEVMTSASAGGWLWDALVAAGCTPCGLAARDSLRLEAALALHGHDIDEKTTPWEAGFGWAVSLDHEFRGRQTLIESRAATRRRLSCILVDAPGVVRAGCAILCDGREIGVVTSGGYSPVLEKSIAMGYLPLQQAEPGTPLTVDVRGRQLGCHVVRRPFVKAGKPAVF